MPLTPKGKKILKKMKDFYKKKTGSSSKGTQVFYSSISEGKLTGVEDKKPKKKGK